MDASEIEFLGENETVTIVPNFSEGRISLIQVSQSFQFIANPPLCV